MPARIVVLLGLTCLSTDLSAGEGAHQLTDNYALMQAEFHLAPKPSAELQAERQQLRLAAEVSQHRRAAEMEKQLDADAHILRGAEKAELGRIDHLMKREESAGASPTPKLAEEVRERKEELLAEAAAHDAADVDFAADATGFPGLELEDSKAQVAFAKQPAKTKKPASAKKPADSGFWDDAGKKELETLTEKHRGEDGNIDTAAFSKELNELIKRKMEKLEKTQKEVQRKEEEKLKQSIKQARARVQVEKEWKLREMELRHAEQKKQADAAAKEMAQRQAEQFMAHDAAMQLKKKYTLAEAGVDCANGTSPVSNRTECSVAALAHEGVDMIPWVSQNMVHIEHGGARTKVSTNEEWLTRPFGCWRHMRNNHFNFNPRVDGKLNVEDQRVCAAPAEVGDGVENATSHLVAYMKKTRKERHQQAQREYEAAQQQKEKMLRMGLVDFHGDEPEP